MGACVQAQVEGQAAKQKEALYRAALQDLTLFKSRTSAALLQASGYIPSLFMHDISRSNVQLISQEVGYEIKISN